MTEYVRLPKPAGHVPEGVIIFDCGRCGFHASAQSASAAHEAMKEHGAYSKCFALAVDGDTIRRIQ